MIKLKHWPAARDMRMPDRGSAGAPPARLDMSRPAGGSGYCEGPGSGAPAAVAPGSFWFPSTVRHTFGIGQVPVE